MDITESLRLRRHRAVRLDLRQQVIALRRVAGAAVRADVRFVGVIFFLASERSARAGGGEMAALASARWPLPMVTPLKARFSKSALAAYNFGAKPKPYPASADLEKRAFNGVTIGKGHLAEAKAAINPAAGARGAFSNTKTEAKPHAHASEDSCGTGDTTQRDDLLAKIDPSKKTNPKPE